MNDDASRPGSAEAPQDFLSAAWRRLKEHRIAQWTVGYIALAYGIQHAVILTSESFEWPNIVARVTMLLLILGVPVAMTLAWYHGEHASRRVSGAELTIIAILLAGVAILFNSFINPFGETRTAAVPVQEAGVIAARRASLDSRGAISVAVMPFANLSGDKDQEYFSDGMTDEISGALAKIPDLRVVARSSAFRFKGKDQDARALGKSLGATHLIEGSVRKAGDQLRISTELIKADDGVTVWSNSYDRQLKDVFAVQEDIARAIAGSFHMALGLKPGENLVNNRKIDTASYEDYLHARALLGSRDIDTLPMAEKLLEDVTAKNPQFAPALAELALIYYFDGLATNGINGYSAEARAHAEEKRSKGEAAARRAVELDANDAGAYEVLAVYASTRGHMLEADGLYSKAMSIDPLNAELLDSYAVRLGSAGHVKDALKLLETAHAVDPFSPLPTVPLVEERWLNGQNEEAITLAKTLPSRLGAGILANIYSSEGRLADAADVEDMLKDDPSAAIRSASGQAAKLLRAAAAKATPPATLPVFPPQHEFVYLYAGAPQRVLDDYRQRADANYFGGNTDALVWHPSYGVVRGTALFKELIKKAGMIEYWRAKGWPPQCHPTAGDDFECN